MAPLGSVETGPKWLVASISEACHNSGVANIKPPSQWFMQKPTAFSFRQGVHLLGAPDQGSSSATPSDACSSSSLSCEDFRVKSRRQHQHLARQVQQFLLQSGPDIDPADVLSTEASRFAALVRMHILSKLGMLGMAHRHMLQQFERARHFVFSRRSRDDGAGVNGVVAHGHAAARVNRQAQRLFDQGLQLEHQLDPEAAAKVFEQLVRLEPSSEAYSRLSKQYSDLSYMPGVPTPRIVELNTLAIEAASQAVDLDPHLALGHIARCVSRGRLALVSDNKTKVQLAKDASDDAKVALALEPNNDLAHHLAGRWHYEMAGINPVVRTLVRWLYGTALMQGRYQDALEHFRTAAQLCPERVIHRVELGRTMWKLGDQQGAVRELEGCLDLDIEDINAQLQREDALRMLAQLKKSGSQGLFFTQPQAETSSASSSRGSSSANTVKT
mmetsp:Transcript_32574/g.71909  ORF Transcript_32574/g.71909 Transcript_32574/m.71909 type:complete len:443 (+) Transcript_32574:245-1573(+)